MPIRRDPASATPYELRAESLTRREEYEKAVADLDRAIQLEPDDRELLCFRASLWSILEEFDKAIADYSRAIILDPDIADAYLKRGEAWSAKNQHDKAIADSSGAIKVDPTCAEAFLSRGKEWRAKGDLDRAVADFTEAIRLSAKNHSGVEPFDAATDAVTRKALRCRGEVFLDKKEQAHGSLITTVSSRRLRGIARRCTGADPPGST